MPRPITKGDRLAHLPASRSMLKRSMQMGAPPPHENNKEVDMLALGQFRRLSIPLIGLSAALWFGCGGSGTGDAGGAATTDSGIVCPDGLTANITVDGAPAGEEVTPFTNVSLSGLGSTAPGSTAVVSFTWTLVAAPAGGTPPLTGSGSTITFTADATGSYTVELVVTDSNGCTERVSVTINVVPAGQSPAADRLFAKDWPETKATSRIR
jgi:hypothetical protein